MVEKQEVKTTTTQTTTKAMSNLQGRIEYFKTLRLDPRRTVEIDYVVKLLEEVALDFQREATGELK